MPVPSVPCDIADISLAVHMRNLRWARVEPPVATAPKAMAWLDRVQSHPILTRLNETTDKLMRTPPAEQRALMRQLGFTVAEDSIASAMPRRGPMTL